MAPLTGEHQALPHSTGPAQPTPKALLLRTWWSRSQLQHDSASRITLHDPPVSELIGEEYTTSPHFFPSCRQFKLNDISKSAIGG